MSKRVFDEWLSLFKDSIADYRYYTDFNKVYSNIEKNKKGLSLLNTLIGCENIEQHFDELVSSHPEVLNTIPILLAKREPEVFARDEEGGFNYRFDKMNLPFEQYKVFMRKTGLFDLLQNHLVGNIIDYAIGIETGLDSHGRKSRGGDLMENLVEEYIIKAGFTKGINYFKEMGTRDIECNWGLDLSNLSNQGKAEKRFDFVVRGSQSVYGIETNFYTTQGSKLNETARSYKTLSLEAQSIPGFRFIWITDGKGWLTSRNNLQEIFDIMDDLYCISELEQDILEVILK